MKIGCSYGEISEIYGYGLLRNTSSQCSTASANLDFIDEDCRNEGQFKPEHANSSSNSSFITYFNKECIGKSKCTVPVAELLNYPKDAAVEQRLQDKCLNELTSRSEKGERAWVAYAGCRSPTVALESLGIAFEKERLGLFVVAVDVVAIVGILMFIKIMKLRQAEFIQ